MMTTRDPRLEGIFGRHHTISLEYEEGDTPRFVLSRVEEVAPDRLWVAMPVRAATLLPLPRETPVMVHIRREDGVYTVPTRVAGRRLQPAPMLELAVLGEVERRQQREYVRLKIMLIPTSATVITATGEEERLAVTVVNLSAGGVLLRGRQPLEVGQTIRLVLDLPIPDGRIVATATVIRVEARRSERGLFHEAGCTLNDLDDRERDQITAFIFRFQARHARRETGDLA
jgi:c-di-GMP-binding flagellar brake protein YcgR